MSIPQSVAEILRDRITLEVEGIDRLYLNVYVPNLQTEGGVFGTEDPKWKSSPSTCIREVGTGNPSVL